MKVTCDQHKLREGLAIATTVIPAKSARPVLENVCLVATDDALELVGTDTEVSVRYRIDDVDVSEPGPVLIPARTASDFVRDLSGEKVELSTEGERCLIRSGDDTCELVTVDADEFPVVNRFQGKGTLRMQGGTFTKMVGQTSFAAARDPGRYAMHGVLTEVENDLLRMVATDGRRLALVTTPAECTETPSPAIVPTKGMQLFCRVIEDPLDQISLSFEDNMLGLKAKNAEIFARLIEGDFPRYAAVIPGESTNSMEADAGVLSRKLRLVSNVAGDESRAVLLKLGKDSLQLFGQSAGRGEATANMPVEFKNNEAEITFNPDYVLDGLKNCESDNVRLEFNERTSPGLFRLGENYIYVVMPITIDIRAKT